MDWRKTAIELSVNDGKNAREICDFVKDSSDELKDADADVAYEKVYKKIS